MADENDLATQRQQLERAKREMDALVVQQKQQLRDQIAQLDKALRDMNNERSELVNQLARLG
jgi:septal ring factor EnvC (AmiA/AmiB activator)